jgi:hypothetical protein
MRGADQYPDQELVHELHLRLHNLWQCARHVAETWPDPELQSVWRELEFLEQQKVDRLTKLIAEQAERPGCRPVSARSN